MVTPSIATFNSSLRNESTRRGYTAILSGSQPVIQWTALTISRQRILRRCPMAPIDASSVATIVYLHHLLHRRTQSRGSSEVIRSCTTLGITWMHYTLYTSHTLHHIIYFYHALHTDMLHRTSLHDLHSRRRTRNPLSGRNTEWISLESELRSRPIGSTIVVTGRMDNRDI